MNELLTYWGRELLTVALLLPYLWYKEKQQVTERKENNKITQEWFNRIAISVWKNIVNNNDLLIDIWAKYVALASVGKINYLRELLNNQSDLKKDEVKLKKMIRNRLEKLSYSQYIKPLNQVNTWTGKLLWDWIWENFPFDDFLEELYKIFFWIGTIEEKLIQIESLMEWYQSDMWWTLRLQLNHY